MMNKLKRIAAFLTAAVLAFSLTACGGDTAAAPVKTVAYKSLKLPVGVASGTVAENADYSLAWDAQRACVLLTDKADGTVWSTIPYDFYATEKTSGREITAMGAPLMLNYVTRSNKSAVKSVNGYTGIIKNGRIGSEKIENGVKVYYCFDKLETIIPVEYTLRETGICISVVPGEIVEYDNLVYKISVAPFLCSAVNGTENTYLAVPSGSGALMYTDERPNGKARVYSEEVYGADPVCNKSEQLLNTMSVRLPVFGAKNGDRAICAIIEQGAACALVEATAGDEKIGYSAVYPTFCLRGRNVSTVSFQNGSVSEVETISEGLSSYERLSVGYYPLRGEEAGYAGMANVCRNYFADTADKSGVKTDEKPLTVNILGGMQIKHSMLGIPYQKTVSATTFAEALDIVKQVESAADMPMDVVLTGFGKSGLDIERIAGGYDFAAVFGGKKNLNALRDYCAGQGTGLFTDFDVIRYHSSGNGFSKTFDAAKASNSFTAFQYHYSVALRNQSNQYPRYMLLKRAVLKKASEKAVAFSNKLGLTGISLSTLGSIAYSDYDSEDSFVRGGMDTDVISVIGAARKNGLSVLVSDANSYAAAAADKITDAPVNSSMYDVLDTDIPLYQMVFKGVTDISAAAVNTAINPRKRFLQAIEGGSGLGFVLSARYETDFATTEHSAFAVSLISDNLDMIKSMAEESRGYYAAINGAKITGHSLLSDTLHRTRFDNGVTLWVNYADEAVTLPEGTVGAKGFMFRGDVQ